MLPFVYILLYYHVALTLGGGGEGKYINKNNQRYFLHCIVKCHILVLLISQLKVLHLACTTVEKKVLRSWDSGTSLDLWNFAVHHHISSA